MKAELEKLLGAGSLMRMGLLLTVANIATGILGYAYQVVMGRMLSPNDFALFSAIIALTMFISSPLSALLMVISRRVSTLRAQARSGALRHLYWRTHAYLVLAALTLFLALLPLANTAQTWLRSPTQKEIWLFAGVLVCFAFITVNNAFFQGLQRFAWLGGTGMLAVLLKLILGAVFIALGYGVSGALTGLLLATTVVWMIGLVKITRGLPQLRGHGSLPDTHFSIKTVIPVLVANVAFSAMTQLDMVLVNWYFAPKEAGLYAAASVLGKAVLYLPGGLVFALFPMVAEDHARKKSSAHLLRQTVLFTIVFCGLAALMYFFFGVWLVGVLYGPGYTGAGELLRWYGFAILPMALVMVAEHFLIAKGRILFVWLFMAMAPIQVLAIHLWHDQLWHVIAIMGVSGGALVSVGYAMLWFEFKKNISAKLEGMH